MRRLAVAALPLLAQLTAACGTPPESAPSPLVASTLPAPPTVTVEAGFLDVPARDVTLKGQPVQIGATARLFYNLQPADESPETQPIFFLFNGFAAEIVRAYGTGPTTVALGGAVVPNPASLTRFANLVYLEPRQAGYSYDVLAHGTPGPADCSPDIFNEYVDAADVLLGALLFLGAHPELRGPVYWVGESFAGVRITWILAYLRGRWDLASYTDPTLAAAIAAAAARPASLHAGQILLEAWLAGGAHDAAINAECTDPVLLAGVSGSLGTPCAGTDACACTLDNDRSLYNYTYTGELETEREMEADDAHVIPERAAAMLGVPLTAIPGLAAAERRKGFKCSPVDDTVPSEDAILAALGPLPAGQSYFVPYSPLLPGKETMPTAFDWYTENFEGVAFVDNLHEVPAFLTQGDRDLVVPTRALAPALRAILGDAAVDDASPSRLGVRYPDGERFIAIRDYPSAGHMITMAAPAALASDIASWLTAPPE
jgi:hypothetical protein